MKMKGQDVADTILEWAKDELKGGPSRAYDLGKFFFSVSSATAGLIAGLQKLGGLNQFVHRRSLIVALIILAISICVALDMVRPRVWDENSDLHYEYLKHIKRALRSMWVWFITWIVGTILGLYAVLL